MEEVGVRAIPEIHLNSSANRMTGKGNIERVSQSTQDLGDVVSNKRRSYAQ